MGLCVCVAVAVGVVVTVAVSPEAVLGRCGGPKPHGTTRRPFPFTRTSICVIDYYLGLLYLTTHVTIVQHGPIGTIVTGHDPGGPLRG